MIEPERRNLAWTPRWGIVRVNRRQSVAEHMYFTACYADWLARLAKFTTDEYQDTMFYMLKHDEAECFMSDIPGPIKRRVKGDLDGVETEIHDRIFEPMPETTLKMRAVKKLADVMDECFYLVGEITSGNQQAAGVYNGCITRLRHACNDFLQACRVTHFTSFDLFNQIYDKLQNEENVVNKIVQELVGQ